MLSGKPVIGFQSTVTDPAWPPDRPARAGSWADRAAGVRATGQRDRRIRRRIPILPVPDGPTAVTPAAAVAACDFARTHWSGYARCTATVADVRLCLECSCAPGARR